MTNRFRPHILVLPEDRANRELVRGFQLSPAVSFRCMHILPEAGGWLQVVETFQRAHAQPIEQNPHRFMILLIDFDCDAKRLTRVKEHIPRHLDNRVVVLGCWDTPEVLKSKLGSYETIGRALARDCVEETTRVWCHEDLIHNGIELDRLRQAVRPILFQS